MEPSRDDFIIAIRSAFLKRGTKQRFSLLGLLFFSILLIVLGKFNFTAINYLKITINEVVYRISFVASLPEKYIGYSYRAVEEHIRFYNDYNLKKEELEKLKSKKYETIFLEAENKRLKKVLNDINYSSELVIAKVIIDKQSPFLRSIIINKGSKNNINKGMAVLSDSYLLGKVVEVNYTTSRVLLLSDLNSKIPVIIEPLGYHAILSGTGKSEPILEFLPENHTVQSGNKVYTSGKEGIFSPGIPIGEVNMSTKNILVSLFSDLTQITFVNINLGDSNN